MITKNNSTTNNSLNKISLSHYNDICNMALDYMLRFDGDSDSQINYALKREHTNRVTGYTEVITRDLQLDESLVRIAQLCALLHDIGRFEQFRQFKTFHDKISVNHAELGVGIIKQNNWLEKLDPETQQIINQVILLHNKIEIPKTENDENVVLISKIIRDADKLDIIHTATNQISEKKAQHNPYFSLNLENNQKITPQIVNAVIDGKLPDKNKLKTVADFTLMIMAFVFDLNFRISFSIINKKQLLKKFFDTMPKNDLVFDAYRKTKIHIENQLIL